MPEPQLELSLDELLTTTRCVRKRLDFDRPVSRELIKECIDIALQAPNGSNRQNWNWVVVSDGDLRRQIGDLYREAAAAHQAIMAERAGTSDVMAEYAGPMIDSVQYLMREIQNAPVMVIPTIEGRAESWDVMGQASQWGSVLPPTWNFMLALRARGLGAAWTTVHLRKEREVAELLGIPYESCTQAGLFPVAYTKGTEFKPGPRIDSEQVIHWDRW